MSEEIPDGFKKTEIGVIPEEWEVVKLDKLIKQISKKNTKNEDIPVFTISNILGFVKSDEFFDKRVYSKKLNTYKLIKTNYFAYNPYRINVGSIGLFKGRIGLVSPAYVVFKVENEEVVSPDFLFRLLKSPIYMSEIKRFSMSRGSVRRSLSFKDLSNFKIPLPPLPEQQKIAHVLSTIQEAKEKTEAIIKAAKELKKSLMKYLFTYGPVPLNKAENVKLKETEIGLIPEDWEVVKLGDIGEFQYGYTETATTKPIGPKFLRITDISDDGVINWATVPYCNIREADFKKYELRNGDILIARIGATTGKTCIIKHPPQSVFASYLIRFSSKIEDVNPFFIYYFTRSNLYWQQINSVKEGKLKKGVSASILKNLLLSLPSSPIQQKIVSILSTIDKKIEREENKKNALEELFKSMLHNLMIGKVRVKYLDIEIEEENKEVKMG